MKLSHRILNGYNDYVCDELPLCDWYDETKKLEEENQRYREDLEQIIKEPFIVPKNCLAKKALEEK